MAKNFNYGNVASVSRRRVKFPDNWEVKTTMSVGKLYPIKWQEVLPGDDFSEDLSFVSRLTSTYIRPVYENLQLSVYAFFVPGRILYDDYESVFGNPNPSAYSDNELGEIPCFTHPFNVSSGTVGDYLELPVGRIAPNGNVSVLPFRAFAMIYNQWFRDQNNVDEILVQHGNLNENLEAPNNNSWSPTNYSGQLPNVKKYPDYFTTAVPSPQKGAPVALPVGVYADVPVYSSSTGGNMSLNAASVKIGKMGGSPFQTGNYALYATLNTPATAIAQMTGDTSSSSGSPTPLGFDNLWAKTSNMNVQAITVDEFRLAMQKQLMLVADTMYGSRYREYLLGHYGVNMKDDRAQVPEFLCGKSIPLAQQQVAQTMQNSGEDKKGVGNLASYSYTASRSGRYFKGFVEHGYVFWVGCLRYKHTYQQGVAKKWTRKVRDDFFDPLYSHIGYQPIYSSELYAVNPPSGNTPDPVKGDKIFGYQEAWSEYKHTPSVITGQARSGITNSLDVYHFADNYINAPVIGKQFVEETPVFVNRTLAVPSSTQDSFIFDFYCKSTKTRIMPLNCEPGYADHWFK